jgi:hypothetical protein
VTSVSISGDQNRMVRGAIANPGLDYNRSAGKQKVCAVAAVGLNPSSDLPFRGRLGRHSFRAPAAPGSRTNGERIEHEIAQVRGRSV